jgi:hypothetical protein
MTMFQIICVSASFAILAVAFAWLYIKRKYVAFCENEDQKERIAILRKKIESARDYVRKTYNTPFDTSVQDNIIPKMEFIEKLIMKKDQNDQERELKFLLDMLTETFIRLRENFNDVGSIVAPLNSLRDRLVQEHIQFIKDHMPEEFEI